MNLGKNGPVESDLKRKVTIVNDQNVDRRDIVWPRGSVLRGVGILSGEEITGVSLHTRATLNVAYVIPLGPPPGRRTFIGEISFVPWSQLTRKQVDSVRDILKGMYQELKPNIPFGKSVRTLHGHGNLFGVVSRSYGMTVKVTVLFEGTLIDLLRPAWAVEIIPEHELTRDERIVAENIRQSKYPP